MQYTFACLQFNSQIWIYFDIKHWFPSDYQKNQYYSFNIDVNSKNIAGENLERDTINNCLLLMRCKIIKLPVLKIRAKRLKTSINKEQRLPAASNLNEFDTLMSNICLGSLKVCTTYWKHIYIPYRILSAFWHRLK